MFNATPKCAGKYLNSWFHKEQALWNGLSEPTQRAGCMDKFTINVKNQYKVYNELYV